MKKWIYIVSYLLLSQVCASAQTPLWGCNIGGQAWDIANVTKVAPNGNVYVAGKFNDTVDIDPGPGVNNIISKGKDDLFVACYNSIGAFLWGFGIGGTDYDAAVTMTIDAYNNVIIGGYIQSDSIDFDPGPGIAHLPFAGGAALTYFGDGFIAKYDASGNYQWSHGIGGPSIYDHIQGLATDITGNIYAIGEFNNTITIPGGPTFYS